MCLQIMYEIQLKRSSLRYKCLPEYICVAYIVLFLSLNNFFFIQKNMHLDVNLNIIIEDRLWELLYRLVAMVI